MTLPDWLQTAVTALNSLDEGIRKKAMSDLMLIPALDLYPKPVEARTWRFEEWAEWVNKVGFATKASEEPASVKNPIFGDASVGAVRIEEPLFGEIGVRLSRIMDNKASINAAYHLRTFAKTQYERYARFMATLIVHMEEMQAPPESLYDPKRFAAFSRFCYREEVVRERIMQLVAQEQDIPCGSSDEYRQLLRTAKTEFGVDESVFFSHVGINQEDMKKVRDAVRAGSKQIPQFLLGFMRDVLDLLRAQDKELREEKQRKREAEEAERLAKIAEKNKPSTKYRAEIDALKKSMSEGLEAVTKAARSVLLQAEKGSAQIHAAAFPAPPDGIDDLPALRTAIAELERSIKDDPWRNRLQALAELIMNSTSDGNLTKLVTTSPMLREQATKELDAIKDAEKKLARMKK